MQSLADQTRAALRRLAKSVAIITLTHDGRRFAMAATAVEGLSLDPPSMLICVAQSASIADPIRGGARFAINLLSDQHAALPARCSAPFSGEERFGLGQWSAPAENEPPLLADAQASFVCTPDNITAYGTHFVIIGRIERVQLDGAFGPLVFADGAYHRLALIQPKQV